MYLWQYVCTFYSFISQRGMILVYSTCSPLTSQKDWFSVNRNIDSEIFCNVHTFTVALQFDSHKSVQNLFHNLHIMFSN